MRQIASLLTAGLIAGLAFIGAAKADDRPVVVELYTSQGCSSCPPADAYLADLAGRDDVIPLALHVDYWDYIGWKDAFADPQFTTRQKAYAAAAGRRSIYTPQMIVNGQEHVVGNHPKDVAALISRHASHDVPVELTLQRTGETLQIVAVPQIKPRRTVVQLVRYLPQRSVQIRSGENAGRTISYVNIVTSWERLDHWDMRTPLTLSAKVKGTEPVVVILQEVTKKGPGRILNAARLR